LRRYAVAALTMSVSIAQMACMGACDIYQPAKTLPGGYRLVLFENSSYYIDQGGGRDGGLLGGSVSQVGWTDAYIVAWRSDPVSGARGVGWMIINLTSGGIEGPLSPEQFDARRREDAALQSIPIYRVDEAWKHL
jgi:hypothetical protein